MKGKAAVTGLVIAVLFLCLSVPCDAQPKAKVIELSYSSHFPANYGMEICSMKWAEEIEKRTNGKVKITFYHSGTLTPPNAIYEGVVKGISDIGHSVFSYTRGRFPLMEVVDLPGYPVTAVIPSLVARDMNEKFKPKELNDVHVLYLHAHIPGGYFLVSKQVNKLEDMKGLRIRAAGMAARMIELLGGIPVSMPKGDQYDAMQKGVVDGTVGGPNELIGWKVAEVSKTSTWVPRAGYLNTMFIAMNKKKWSSLPPDVQKVFTEVSKLWTEVSGKEWDVMDSDGVAYGKKMKHIFVVTPPEETARWVKVLQPMQEEFVKGAQAKGLPGKEALQYRQELIEKYSKMHPPIKLE
jgi:TRAP-type transport system periplasmic protein